MSNYREIWEQLGKMSAEKAEQDKKFPALISTKGTLKILNHHELPVGESFTILELGPLTPASVLKACLLWTQQQIAIAISDERR